MIKLTKTNGGTIYYLNPDLMISIEHDAGTDGSEILMTHAEYMFVTESPEQVSRLITEYKQRQMRLQAAYAHMYRGHLTDEMREEVAILESEDRGE